MVYFKVADSGRKGWIWIGRGKDDLIAEVLASRLYPAVAGDDSVLLPVSRGAAMRIADHTWRSRAGIIKETT